MWARHVKDQGLDLWEIRIRVTKVFLLSWDEQMIKQCVQSSNSSFLLSAVYSLRLHIYVLHLEVSVAVGALCGRSQTST